MTRWGDDWEALLKPLMKQAGFRKKGRTWYFHSPQTIGVLNLQMSPWGGGDFYINLGVLVRAIAQEHWPKEYQCHFRQRLSNLMPDPWRAQKLFEPGDDRTIEPATRQKEILSAVETLALPLLNQCRAIAGLRKAIGPKPVPSLKTVRKLLEFFDIPVPAD